MGADTVGVQSATYAKGTANATVKATAGRVWGLFIALDAVDTPCTVELIDGGASGTSKWKQTMQCETAGNLALPDINLHGLSFGTDIYIAMSGYETLGIVYS
jgi:hypothetical protein